MMHQDGNQGPIAKILREASSIAKILREASSVFVCVQPHSTTLFGVPFPRALPTPQGHWDRQLRDKPETEIRELR